MSAHYVRSIQNKHLLEIFSFLSNNRRKIGNARTGTEIVNPCINYKIYFIERYRNLGGQSNLKNFYREYTGASGIKLYLKVLKILGSSLVVFLFHLRFYLYIFLYVNTKPAEELSFFYLWRLKTLYPINRNIAQVSNRSFFLFFYSSIS